MERHNQVVDDGISEPQLIGDIIAEDFYHILIVHTILGSCQAQQEFWFKIVDNLAITIRHSMMTLIDNDIIKFFLVKEFERTAHGDIGRKQEILTRLLSLCIIQSASLSATKYLLEGFQ